MDRKTNSEIPIRNGSIVKHFKWELLSNADKKGNKYLYKVLYKAIHTETGEQLIIYQALYGDFLIFARPISDFFNKINKDKYPNIKQKYKFEVLEK